MYCYLLQKADRDVSLTGRADCAVSVSCPALELALRRRFHAALLHPLHRPSPDRAAHEVATLQPHALLRAGGSPCFQPQHGTAAVSRGTRSLRPGRRELVRTCGRRRLRLRN
ncbi:hypothetical protein Nmel_007380 [Mimus melanotis]